VIGDRRVAIDQAPCDIRVDDELLLLALLPKQVHREDRPIYALPHAAEPDQRHLQGHRLAQRPVLGVVRIVAAPLVAEQPVGADRVLIWTDTPSTV